MKDRLSKNDLPFLVEAMDRQIAGQSGVTVLTADSATDKVSGEMSVPEPVTVDANGDMSAEDYKACSTIMAVCQNMVQKNMLEAANAAGVKPADALKNMGAWVKAYVDFPFPFFNFKDTQSQTLKKDTFSLKADPDVVAEVVNIKNVADLQAAVLGALKKSDGNIASYEGTDKNFNYFGVITGYTQTAIQVRLVKFQLHLKETKVKSLCVSYDNTKLDSIYDTYMFEADKELMIKMQEKMGDQMVEYFAEKLLDFIKEFYDKQLKDYKEALAELFKSE